MRVTLCVDALEPQLAGIGRYTWELCKGLAARDDISQLQFYGRNRLIDDPARLLRGEKVKRGRGLVRLARTMKARRALRSTIVHGPNFFLPAHAETGVITVHDLSVLRYPETHPAARVKAFERLFMSSIDRAAHLITDTETVRDEIIDAFSLPREQVTAVPLGVDARFRPFAGEQLSPVLRQWGVAPGRYGLSVSTLEPRKKIAELVRAWRGLPPALREAFPLVIAGGAGWRNEDVRDEIRRGETEGWLRHVGFVEDSTLPQLYAGAALFIYPSVYEGFGLPPVEAMASGAPVIVSNRSCLPEVCGDAARYVDPDDAAGFTLAVEECLSDPDWRSKSAQRGLDRANRFTWDRCIEATVAVYHHLSRGL